MHDIITEIYLINGNLQHSFIIEANVIIPHNFFNQTKSYFLKNNIIFYFH